MISDCLDLMDCHILFTMVIRVPGKDSVVTVIKGL